MSRVNRQLDELIQQGWYLKEDAEEMRAEAALIARAGGLHPIAVQEEGG